eukprot:12650-Heterococcus_DN1.PRE.2
MLICIARSAQCGAAINSRSAAAVAVLLQLRAAQRCSRAAAHKRPLLSMCTAQHCVECTLCSAMRQLAVTDTLCSQHLLLAAVQIVQPVHVSKRCCCRAYCAGHEAMLTSNSPSRLLLNNTTQKTQERAVHKDYAISYHIQHCQMLKLNESNL